jgi:uncharacterized protein YqgC (DUF456 family)
MMSYESVPRPMAIPRTAAIVAMVFFFALGGGALRSRAADLPASSRGDSAVALAADPVSRSAARLDHGGGAPAADIGAGGVAVADSGDAESAAGSEGVAVSGAARDSAAGDKAQAGSGEEGGEHWLRRLGRGTVSVLGRVVLYLVLLVGLVLIPLGLGGTFVMVAAAAVFGLLTGFEHITLRLLAVLLGLALVGEGVESLLGVAMARRYGASKWGMWGAFLGGIAGALVGAPIPVVGNVIGALIGVFAGAFALEWIGQGRSGSSLKAGWGALLGRTAAGAIKIALGMVIMILIISRTLS